jgi:hypothetical protein
MSWLVRGAVFGLVGLNPCLGMHVVQASELHETVASLREALAEQRAAAAAAERSREEFAGTRDAVVAAEKRASSAEAGLEAARGIAADAEAEAEALRHELQEKDCTIQKVGSLCENVPLEFGRQLSRRL